MKEENCAEGDDDSKNEEPKIEANFFYNKSINYLVTINNAIKWSEDNRLSVITSHGVLVFDFVPSPMQAVPILTLLQTHINCPETTPSDIYAEEVEAKMYDWSGKDIRSFLMKSTFTPNFPHALKASPNIVDVFWSPQDLLCPSKCLLAILTSHGVVELAVLIKHYWLSIHDFSAAWIETVNDDIQTLSQDDIDCNVLSNQMERLQATSVAWSPLKTKNNDSPFAYLTIGHRNSEIVVWKVHQVTIDTISVDLSINVEMKFKKKVLMQNIKINALLWVQVDEGHYLLLIGFFDGQFGSLKLQEFEGGVTCSPYVSNYDPDSSPVHDLQILQQRSNNIEVIVIKEKHIFFLTLDDAGKEIEKKFILIPGFTITGVSLLTISTVLVATQDGNLCLVKKTLDEGNLVLEPITTDIARSDVQYLGLASSRNKILHAVITSPRYLYDHLVDREPSCISFFYLEDSSIIDPLTILFGKQNLCEFWDCLELVKIIALKYNQQPKLPSGLDLDFESMPLHKLRVIYWVMVINETFRKKYFPYEQSELLEDIELCRFNIFLHTAINHLTTLIHKDNLGDFQKLCMSLIVKQFDSYLSTNESNDSSLVNSIKNLRNVASRLGLPAEEKCNLCEETILEPRASTCPAGHLLTRCALTLLQVTCVKFRSCMVCQEIFHPSLDTEMKEVKCLYCDLPALYKIRTIDSAIVNSMKNLSKKVHIAGSKDSKDDGGD